MPNVNLWSKTSSANASSDPPINYQEGQLPSTLNNSDRTVMSAIANDRDDTRGALTTTGTQPAYAISTNSTNTVLQRGLYVMAKVHAAPTGACTLNVDGTGARKWYDGNLVQLNSASLTVGEMAGSVYDNTLDSGVGGWIRVTNPGSISTITAGMIPAGLITGTMILDGTVAAAELASNSVTTAKILDANVTTAKIADANVTTAKIADANITLPKLATSVHTSANWTPVVSTSSGTLSSASASGAYWTLNNLLFFQVVISIGSNGTGAGWLLFSGPPGLNITSVTGYGRDNSVSGKMVAVNTLSSSSFQVVNYDSTYPGSSGAIISVHGFGSYS